MGYEDAYKEHIRKILVESRKDMYSWMNSKGKTFSIIDYRKKDHGDLAKYLLADASANYSDMFSLGYLRITHFNNLLYAHNPLNKPNPQQLKSLKDIAIENRMLQVLWDSEEDDVVLWHNDY